jgi:DNA-binding IclR family transcriptional regulator
LSTENCSSSSIELALPAKVHVLEYEKTISAKIAVHGAERIGPNGAQAIERASTLLLLVGRAGPAGARLSEMVDQSDLPKPTVRRMLLALVRAGLLDQDPETRRYYLGPEIHVLGMLASARFGIHSISLRSLVRLSQQTGDTAFLSVPRGVYSICVHREEGPYPIRVHALHAGDRHPLGVGAGGLALLAALPDEDVKEVLAANADTLVESYPTFSPSVLHSLVQDTRRRGYALNPGMLLSDSWAIGVPIHGSDGKPVGALSIAATKSRLTEERQQEIVPLLKKEASWIETRLHEIDNGEKPRPKRG